MSTNNVLTNLIEQFSVENLVQFFRSKARTFTQTDIVVSTDKADFTDGLQVGEFKTDISELAAYCFKVQKPLSERSGKKAQYELAKRILKQEQRYSAGIFVFYDDKGDFRFSLVYDILSAEGKRTWSNFRRFTYFVSKEQTNKTFIRQIGDADFSTLEKIKEAFSVEPISKQFYSEIQNWYFWAMDNVEFPDDEEKDKEKRNAKNLIRMITRIIFIWFMKAQKLIPSEIFDKQFIDKILNYQDKTGSTYYKAILQNLFFATLNTPMKNEKNKDEAPSRIFVDEAPKRSYISDGYLQHGFYRYKRFIKDVDTFLKTFENIPFLNGGLFDCLDKKVDGKEIRIDCFSDNPKKETRLKVPDELFFLDKEITVNLSKYLEKGTNKKVTGLFEILNKYNFTIDENTPIDQEVALDPELLGKVFENLLAAYVPETATTARKATGSYYTPREIVNYMVDESLTEYLTQKMIEGNYKRDEDSESLKNEIRKLLSYEDEATAFNDEDKKILIKAIEDIKILDPACGSGAFPMGILHKLVLVLHKLDPENKIWKEQMINKVPPEIREETKQSLENKPLDYIRKLGLIENCIYGVDIQEIAIQISKLRFFISLLVEQVPDDTKPNRDIKALPNLETKFVAANSLIAIERSSQSVIKDPTVEQLENELFKVRQEIFYSNSRSEKVELQRKEKELRTKLKEALSRDGFGSKVAEQISSWDPFDQNTHANWFDPEWMFGVKDGFDIVIGNPPYIQLQKAFNQKIKYADLYKNEKFQTFDRTGDIYCLFYEKGVQLLKQNGLLCYITSNKWMRAGYGEKLRQYFIKHNPLVLVDLGPGVFENATVDTNILLIQKESTGNISVAGDKNRSKNVPATFNLNAVTLQKENNAPNITQQLKERGVVLSKLTNDAWFIGSDAEQRLKEKIERIGKPLKDWDVKIYRGVLTGLNEAFIITTEKRDEILANCQDDDERRRTEAIIKPILRGRDIKRYYYEWAGLWVIIIPAGWTNENKGKKEAEKFIQESFPSLMQHLKLFEEKAKRRDDQGDYWWELRHCAYYPEFEKEKVVWKALGLQPAFAYVPTGFYNNDKANLLTSDNVSLKFLLGFFNSNIFQWIFKNIGINMGKGFEYKIQFMENIPLPPITPSNQPIVSQIEVLVDKILTAKKQNPQTNTSHWEREIDKLVYELYGLTEEEIRIVEK